MKHLLLILFLLLSVAGSAAVGDDLYSSYHDPDHSTLMSPATPKESPNNICRRNFKDKNLEKYGYKCRQLKFSKRSINSVKWNDFYTCIDKMKPVYHINHDLVSNCLTSSYVYWYLDEDFDTCLSKVDSVDDSLLSRSSCSSYYEGKNIISSSFDECMKQVDNLDFKTHEKVEICAMDSGQFRAECFTEASKHVNRATAWKSCESYTVQDKVRSWGFESCMDDLTQLDNTVNKTKYFEICSDTDASILKKCMIKGSENYPVKNLVSMCRQKGFRDVYTNKNYGKCIDKYKEKYKLYDSMIMCTRSSSTLKHIASKKFDRCLQSIKDLNLDDSVAYNVCVDKKLSSEIKDPKFAKCVEKGFKSGINNFFGLKQSEIDKKTTGIKTKTSFYYLFKDCNADIEDGKPRVIQNDYLKLYKDYNMHAFARFQKENLRIGGLSALRFDEKNNKAYLLSDDRGYSSPPRIYVYDYKFREDGELELKEDKTIKITKKNYAGPIPMDPEGFDFIDENNFVISSELDDVGGKDFLNIYGMNGVYKDYIEVNEAFRPDRISKKKCKVSSGFFGWGATKTCYNYSKNKGLLNNKGFESLSISPNKKHLFTANEQSLYQDKRFVKSGAFSRTKRLADRVRIVKYTSEKNKFVEKGQFLYELDIAPDNGVVELLSLNENKILVLERSWDGGKRKITAKIYLVDLSTGVDISEMDSKQIKKAKHLKKKLLIDLDNIIGQLAPGFRVLDNFEGMAFGPTLPNGSESLVLTTDNNFRDHQLTQILILEMNKSKILTK